MTVYVDTMRSPYRGMRMSHMVADSTAELLAMADRIGVARRWLQCAGTYREHFDVCESMRAAAVRAGAVEISERELGAILVRRRRGAAAVEDFQARQRHGRHGDSTEGRCGVSDRSCFCPSCQSPNVSCYRASVTLFWRCRDCGQRWTTTESVEAERRYVPPKWKWRWPGLVLIATLALATFAAAQEPEPPTWPPPVEEPAEEPAAVEPEPPPSPWPELAVVAWCEVSGRDAAEPVAEPVAEGEVEMVAVEDIGCDLGLGLSLYSWPIGKGGRYSLEAVASIGERSVGAGLGWCRGRLCIGVGGAAIRDDLGINTDTLAPVAGATWSFGGLRE